MIRTAAPAQRPDGVLLEDYAATTGEAAAAAGARGLDLNPLAQAGFLFRFGAAGGGSAAPETDEFGNDVAAFAAFARPRPVLSAEEANERYGSLGLTFDGPIHEEAAAVLAGRERLRIAREDVLRRAPRTFVSQSAQLAAELGASLLDPLNVALAFVPVVGQARAAALAARFGTVGGRAAVGAIEGAAGAALLEPVVLAGAAQRARFQDDPDYTVADTLANIVFGSAIGGGLHVGVGAVGDRLAAVRERRAQDAAQGAARSLEESLAAAPAATREAFMRTAVAQAREGRAPDLDALRRFIDAHAADVRAGEEFDALFRGEGDFVPVRDPFDPTPRPEGRSLADAPEARAWTAPVDAAGYDLRPADADAVLAMARDLEGTDGGYRIFLEVDGQGGTPEVRGVPSTVPQWFRDLSRTDRVTREEVRRVADKLAERAQLTRREARVATELVGVARQDRARVYVQVRQQRAAERQRAWEDLMELARRMGDDDDPSGDLPGADADAARAVPDADGPLDRLSAPGADDDRAVIDVVDQLRFDDLRAAGALTPEERTAFAELDRADEVGEAVAAAAERAALCLVRGAA